MSDEMRHARALADAIGPRPAGTNEEQQAAQYLADLFRGRKLKTQVDEFSCTPNTSMSYAVCYALTFIAMLLSNINTAMSVICLILALAGFGLLVVERSEHGIISRATRNGLSQNVIAQYTPQAPPRARRQRPVVVVAHYDSERNALQGVPFLTRLYPAARTCAFVGAALVAFICLLQALPFPFSAKGNSIIWGITFVCAIPALIGLIAQILRMFSFKFNDGANNNASGVAAMVGVVDRLIGRTRVGAEPDAMQVTPEVAKTPNQIAAEQVSAVERAAEEQQQAELEPQQDVADSVAAPFTPGIRRHTTEQIAASGVVPEGVGLIVTPEAEAAAQRDARLAQAAERSARTIVAEAQQNVARKVQSADTESSAQEPGSETAVPLAGEVSPAAGSDRPAAALRGRQNVSSPPAAAPIAADPQAVSAKKPRNASAAGRYATHLTTEPREVGPEEAKRNSELLRHAQAVRQAERRRREEELEKRRSQEKPEGQELDGMPSWWKRAESARNGFRESVADESEASVGAGRAHMVRSRYADLPIAPTRTLQDAVDNTGTAAAAASAGVVAPGAAAVPVIEDALGVAAPAASQNKPAAASAQEQSAPVEEPAAEVAAAKEDAAKLEPEPLAAPEPTGAPEPAPSKIAGTEAAQVDEAPENLIKKTVEFPVQHVPAGELIDFEPVRCDAASRAAHEPTSVPESAASPEAQLEEQDTADNDAKITAAARIEEARKAQAEREQAAARAEAERRAAIAAAAQREAELDRAADAELGRITSSAQFAGGYHVSTPVVQPDAPKDAAGAELGATQRFEPAAVEMPDSAFEPATDRDPYFPEDLLVGSTHNGVAVPLPSDASRSSKMRRIVNLASIDSTTPQSPISAVAPVEQASASGQRFNVADPQSEASENYKLSSNVIPINQSTRLRRARLENVPGGSLNGSASIPVIGEDRFVPGNTPLQGTGTFAPVGNPYATGGVFGGDIIDDADDVTNYNDAPEGIPASGYVDIPDSRAHRFFDRISDRFSGRKQGKGQDDSSLSEWLDVDEDFDARKEGRQIGSWDNFDDEDNWKGGGTSTRGYRDADGTRRPFAYDSNEDYDTSEAEVERRPAKPVAVHPVSSSREAKRIRLDGRGGYAHVQDEYGARSGYRGAQEASERDEPQGMAEPVRTARRQPRRYRPRESFAAVARSYGVNDDDVRDQAVEQAENDLFNRQVWFVALGASGAAHAGARDFLERHGVDVDKAFVINIDAVGAGEVCVLQEEGVDRPYQADRNLVEMAGRAAARIGLPLRQRSFRGRATDAMPFFEGKMRAVTIMGLNGDAPAGWCWGKDSIDDIDPRQIGQVSDLIVTMIKSSK